MKENTLLICLPSGDKNWSLQLYKSSWEKHNHLKIIVSNVMMSERAIYKILGLFIQGDSREWTMVEMWSNNESLFLEFCEHVSKILELPLEFEN
jgi:hypothetical protein